MTFAVCFFPLPVTAEVEGSVADVTTKLSVEIIDAEGEVGGSSEDAGS